MYDVTDVNTSQSRAPEPPPTADTTQAPLGSPLGTAASGPTGAAGERAATFHISAWALARSTLVVVLVLACLYLLWRIQEVLLLMLLAIIFATAIEPLVNRLRKGPFSRGQGILIVYTVLFAVIVAVGFFFVPGLVDQTIKFVESLPERVASLRPQIDQIGFRPLRELLLRAMGNAQPAFERSLEQPGGPTDPERLVAAGGAFAGAFAYTLFSIVMVFLLAYYWLTERATIKRAVLRLAPASRARLVNAIWLQVEAKLGAWVRGQLFIMLVVGLLSGLIFLVLGLPNPLLLAVLAGLCQIIPIVGPFLAFLPALLVALTLDPTKALILVAAAVVFQQVVGNILIPRVMSQSLGVSPLTVILGIMIGSILYGGAGAFLAVPLAAAIQVILNESLRPALDEETFKVAVPQAELEGDEHPRSASEPAAGRPQSQKDGTAATKATTP
jgi:predicted PurR-regulated permease PerM